MRRILIAVSLTMVLAALVALRPGSLSAPACADPSGSTSGPTRDPVVYSHIVRDNPVNHLHVITVDLTDPHVRLRVCPGGDDPDGPGPWQMTLKTVRDIAQDNHLEAAINGSFFSCKDAHTFAGRTIPYFAGNWATVQGWAMSNGKLLSTIDAGGCSFVVDSKGRAHFGKFHPTLPADAREVVSGAELIVTDGKISTNPSERAPRTAVGVDRAGKKLVMLVVDGRKTDYSTGMNAIETAQAMIDQGCWCALMLDGGGSSTMVMRDPIENMICVLNHPSDGHDLPISMSLERPVACALGVQIVDKP